MGNNFQGKGKTNYEINTQDVNIFMEVLYIYIFTRVNILYKVIHDIFNI